MEGLICENTKEGKITEEPICENTQNKAAAKDFIAIKIGLWMTQRNSLLRAKSISKIVGRDCVAYSYIFVEGRQTSIGAIMDFEEVVEAMSAICGKNKNGAPNGYIRLVEAKTDYPVLLRVADITQIEEDSEGWTAVYRDNPAMPPELYSDFYNDVAAALLDAEADEH